MLKFTDELKKLKKEFLLISNTDCFKLFLIIVSLIFPLLLEKYHYTQEPFSLDRYFIYLFVCLFISVHFIFDIKKLWNTIYKKRYLIGIIIFLYIVFNGYHGSSATIYNYLVEPNNITSRSEPIFGQNRAIRGDEWGVSTPHLLSQTTKINNFSVYNKGMMGGINNNVTLFPKLPVKNLSIVLSPRMIGFIFLPVNQAFSWYWYFDYFVLFFASFEFFMLITKGKKVYSLLGSIMITLAPAVQWWESTQIIYSGLIAILFFDKYLKDTNIKNGILYSIVIGFCGCIYVLSLYPAWMIPYGYIFLGFIIWIICNNKKNLNIKRILLLLLIVIGIMALCLIPIFINSREVLKLTSSTIYPGARFSTGGTGWQSLFNYVPSILLSYIPFGNACETSQFLSFFPVPLVLAFILIFKNKTNKVKDNLLVIMLVIALLLMAWNFIKLPHFVSKITFMYMSTPNRAQITVGFLLNVMLIYMLANYDYFISNKEKKLYFVLSLLIGSASVFITNNIYHYLVGYKMLILILLIFIICYIIMCNYKKTTIFALILISLLSGLFVHPLNKNIDIIYDKHVSKYISEIYEVDNDAVWATVKTQYTIQNYLLANGVKVLNSTNYYPNYKLWDIVDPERKYEDKWNRYAHLTIELVDDETSIDTLFEDQVILYLNKSDICKLNIKYFLTNDDNLNRFSNDIVNIEKIYSSDNIYIYENECK